MSRGRFSAATVSLLAVYVLADFFPSFYRTAEWFFGTPTCILLFLSFSPDFTVTTTSLPRVLLSLPSLLPVLFVRPNVLQNRPYTESSDYLNIFLMSVSLSEVWMYIEVPFVGFILHTNVYR